MPEADFQQISEFLVRGGYDPATEELLDFVWCSPWLCFRQPDPVPSQPPEPPPKIEEEKVTTDPPPGPEFPPAPTPKAPTPAPEIPVPSGIGKEENQRQDVCLDAPGSANPARRVRLAGARPFREALSLTDALRPLRFGVPEATGQLDEDGTADFLARTGLLMPCWESRKVSPFRIEVVVESTRGVLFWSAWVRHWVELLRQATRSRVTLSYLNPVADGEAGTRRHPFVLSPMWPAEREGHPETLGHPGRKRLIFLFTDMMSPLWAEDGPMPALLRDWSRHQTVTVLNPMHRDIWIDSAWARADRGFAHCRELGRVRWLNVSGATVPEKSFPVFHLRLTASAVGNWARTVTARAAVGHPAFTWKVPAVPAKPRSIPPAPVPDPLSIAEFQDLVKEAETGLLTPSGLALLRVLTAAPLTPAIMRLVQRAIYPGLGHEQLSEVHRSGLLYRLPGQPESKDPDRVHYDFLPVRASDGTVLENAMRDHFFNQAGWDRVDEVRELIGDFIARQHGLDSWSVEALQNAVAANGEALAQDLRPFARVLGHVLGRFGDRLEEESKALVAWGRGLTSAGMSGSLSDEAKAQDLTVCESDVDAPEAEDGRPHNSQAIFFVGGGVGSSRDPWGSFPEIVGKLRPEWDVHTLSSETSDAPDLFGIWNGDPELPDLAALFRRKMASEPFSRYKRIAIAAFSMGGLVAQRAVADDPILQAKLAHLYLFGTPSAGLIKGSLLRFWKRQVENMAFGGQFIEKLRADWTERITDSPSFCLHVVAGTKDQFVPPFSSIGPFSERFHRFVPGNHLEIVRAFSEDHPAVRLVVTTLPLDCLNQRLDGEKEPAVMDDFVAPPVIQRLANLPQKPDPQAVSTLALDLDGAGKPDDAIELLLRYKDREPEIMGTLAGRYKRMWVENRGREFAEKALGLYCDAFDLVNSQSVVDARQAYYHAINVAFLALVFCGDHESSKAWARVALHHCGAASATGSSYWSVATVGEANLYLGDYDAALKYYHEALQMLGTEDNWQLYSTWYNAACVSSYLKDPVLEAKLAECFAVLEQPQPARAPDNQ